MPQIVLMIPRKDSLTDAMLKSAVAGIVASAQSGALSSAQFDQLPFVPGECQINGYQFMILVDNVEWDTEVEAERSPDGRRTVHLPKISTVKIKRRLDLATGALTRWALNMRVAAYPWELYFLRGIGDDGTTTAYSGYMQVRFMTLRLHYALVTKYTVEIGDTTAEENIEVSASAIDWIYQQASLDQTMGGQKSVSYDIQAGTLS